MLKKPSKYSNLLQLLVVFFGILSGELKGFNPPDSVICLLPKEYDFYAQALVDRKQLKIDTTVFGQLVRSQEIILSDKNSQIVGLKIILGAKDSSEALYKREYFHEKSYKEKAEKRVSRLRNLSLLLGSATVVLLTVIVLIH